MSVYILYYCTYCSPLFTLKFENTNSLFFCFFLVFYDVYNFCSASELETLNSIDSFLKLQL